MLILRLLKAYTDNRIDTEIARATGEERIEQKLDTKCHTY